MINISSGIFYLAMFSFSLFLGKENNDKWLIIFVVTMLTSVFLWYGISDLFEIQYNIFPEIARWLIAVCFLGFWTFIAFIWKRTVGFTPISLISFFFANSTIYLLSMYALTIFDVINVT